MSQEQPRREHQHQGEKQQQQHDQGESQEAIKYGNVFGVSGELAEKPIAPQDASMMQTAESKVLGQPLPGAAGAVMQAAANINERAGVVGSGDVTDVAGQRGVTVTETDLPGRRIITESVAGQVVGQYVQPVTGDQTTATRMPVGGGYTGGYAPTALITVGEALEAAARTSGDKPVDLSDAAALQAAEFSVTGIALMNPVGLAATAQSAAAYNQGIARDEDKVKLRDILPGAAAKLPADRAVRREDAEAAAQAEIRSSAHLTTHPGGIAASMAAAVRVNEQGQST